MKKRLLIALVLLVLLSTYNPQNISLINKFTIKEINIENNFILKEKIIKKKLEFLYEINLIFLNTFDIEKIFNNIDFIESFEIKKIYPNKVKIKIYEKTPIAILQNKKEKFYISENFEFINYKYLENYKNLPLVFGNNNDFKKIYSDLKKINFPLNLISKYYLYESKRWDLETYEKITIKLPPKNYITSLENFLNLKKTNNFDKYKIFDYRVIDQLILK
jgi:cell division septal protein FtsQ